MSLSPRFLKADLSVRKMKTPQLASLNYCRGAARALQRRSVFAISLPGSHAVCAATLREPVFRCDSTECLFLEKAAPP